MTDVYYRAWTGASAVALACILGGCDTTVREFEVAKHANTESALSAFVAKHGGHERSAEARQLLDQIIQSKIYRWTPEGPLAKEGAKDLQVTQESEDSVRVKGTSESASIPGTIELSVTGPSVVKHYIEGLGSRNIRVVPSEGLGYTKYGGLKFASEAVVAIREDGVIEVDREGVSAKDPKDRVLVSRRVEIGGASHILMIEPL